jgi:hypothetical protein
MSIKITLIRKTKWLFILFRLHRLIEPFSSLFLNLTYLSKVSKWVSQNRQITFNDFYSPKWDYNKRYRLYEYVFHERSLNKEINYLEFGVAGGFSFAWWVSHNTHHGARFIGFDTFEGLPEDWGGFKKGAMTTNALVPEISDPRVSFVKGLFQETLKEVLPTLDTQRTNVIMMDADMYSSTLFVLSTIAPILKRGDLIFFDQFNVPLHEFLAFQNFVASFYIKLNLIGAANNYYFCAFEVV